jgi:hypothetical protein
MPTHAAKNTAISGIFSQIQLTCRTSVDSPALLAGPNPSLGGGLLRTLSPPLAGAMKTANQDGNEVILIRGRLHRFPGVSWHRLRPAPPGRS